MANPDLSDYASPAHAAIAVRLTGRSRLALAAHLRQTSEDPLPLSMGTACGSSALSGVSTTAGPLRGAGAPASARSQSVGQVRYTRFVPDQVVELLLTEAALEKLGARAISAEEAGQVLRNAHVVVRNPRAPIPGTRRFADRSREWRALPDARDRADGRADDLANDHRVGVHRDRA